MSGHTEIVNTEKSNCFRSESEAL